jgi:anti-anti-sigma regulatory factor
MRMPSTTRILTFASSRLDGTTARALLTDARAAFDAGARVLVIDMAAVTTVDSLGVAALVAIAEMAPPGVMVRLAALGSYAQLVARVTHLDEVLDIYATVHAAAA